MHTETIQVQYVNPPNPGGKKGSIKTTDGKLFGVWANKLSEFKPNETYAVEYTEEEWRGQTYRTITKAALEANRTASPSPSPATTATARRVQRTRSACSLARCSRPKSGRQALTEHQNGSAGMSAGPQSGGVAAAQRIGAPGPAGDIYLRCRERCKIGSRALSLSHTGHALR